MSCLSCRDLRRHIAMAGIPAIQLLLLLYAAAHGKSLYTTPDNDLTNGTVNLVICVYVVLLLNFAHCLQIPI